MCPPRQSCYEQQQLLQQDQVKNQYGPRHTQRSPKIWNNSAIGLKMKLHVLKTSVFSVLLYTSETWTLKKADINKLTAFKVTCFYRILKIKWFHHVTNEDVKHHIEAWSKIKQQIKRCKLSLFSHIYQMKDDHLIMLIMQGHIEGRTKQGRLRCRWTNDIFDWCGKELHDTMKLVHNRRELRWLINSDMTPIGLQRPMVIDWLTYMYLSCK